MERQVTICGKDYKLKSSLFSIISYRNTFGSELFSDITAIEKSSKGNEDISRVIDTIFRIFYILHKPFTEKSYEDFLNDFGFDLLSASGELTKLSMVITELFNTTKNVHGENIEKR